MLTFRSPDFKPPQESPMFERFIARQPIFDQRLKVVAYELLFRANSRNVFEPRPNASSSVIVDSTMLFDLQTLTGPAKAFVNVDETALLQGAPKLLPKDRVVVEVLETVSPTREIVDACLYALPGIFLRASRHHRRT
jgi:EAL and modified HD-GYP domain-containing signal transduction protein